MCNLKIFKRRVGCQKIETIISRLLIAVTANNAVVALLSFSLGYTTLIANYYDKKPRFYPLACVQLKAVTHVHEYVNWRVFMRVVSENDMSL